MRTCIGSPSSFARRSLRTAARGSPAFASENSSYGTKSWPELARGLGLLEQKGDLSVLAELAKKEPDNEGAALTAVNCADHTDRGVGGDPRALQRQLDTLLPKFRDASRIFGPGELAEITFCHSQPEGSDFIANIDHPAGIPPMLLVGVGNDLAKSRCPGRSTLGSCWSGRR
ncbi:hypothetical protein [Streptomyces sp. NPDC001970]